MLIRAAKTAVCALRGAANATTATAVYDVMKLLKQA